MDCDTTKSFRWLHVHVDRSGDVRIAIPEGVIVPGDRITVQGISHEPIQDDDVSATCEVLEDEQHRSKVVSLDDWKRARLIH